MVSWGRAGISREVMMQEGCCMVFGGVRRGEFLGLGDLHCIAFLSGTDCYSWRSEVTGLDTIEDIDMQK